MNKHTFNLDTFKNNLTATQVLSTKELQSIKGGQSDPPPFGIINGISDPPPFGR